MARRKSSFIDDLIEIASRIPWWAALLMAIASYLGFHVAAGISPAPPSGVADLGKTAGSTMVRSISTLMQYVVPGALTLGALVGFMKRRRSSRLF